MITHTNTSIGKVTGMSTNSSTGFAAGYSIPNGMNNIFIGYNSGNNTTIGSGIYHPFQNLNIKKIFDNIETIKLIKYKNGYRDYNPFSDLLIERKKLSKKYNKILKEIDIFEIRKNNIKKKLEDNYKELKNSINYFLENKTKDIVEIQYEPTHYSNAYDNCTVLFKNGIIHSVNEPAVKLYGYLALNEDNVYFINGEYYSYDEWIKHPIKISQDRRLKIEKLFN